MRTMGIVLLTAMTVLPARRGQAGTSEDSCQDIVLGLRRAPAPVAPGNNATPPPLQAKNAILVDHATRKAFFVQDNACTALEDGDEFRVRTGQDIPVYVANTLTALYSYSLTQEKVDAEEIATLKSFAKGLGPYLAEGGRRLTPKAGAPPLAPSKKEDEKPEEKVLRLIYGEKGLAATWNAISGALESLKLLEEGKEGAGGTIPTLDTTKNALKAKTTWSSDGKRLGLIKDLLSAYYDVAASYHGKPESEQKVLREILDDQEKVMAAAYQAEELGLSILDCETWKRLPRAVRVSLSKGASLTIKIDVGSADEVSRVAGKSSLTVKATALPDWMFRPSVGLSFLAAPQATYDTFGTKKSGDGVEITQSGAQDSRFTYGLTLGFTTRWTDWRKGMSGFAIWPLEMTVNPSDDVKAVGIGSAVSWSVVKIGAGFLWTKHTDLSGGQFVTMPLPDADSLQTREVYGRPKVYVSLSIFGWPPFVP